MPRPIHETIPVQVWADIDVGIADLVKLLNKIPGVRTFASCQGTIGEGGPEPYRAFVSMIWEPYADTAIDQLKDNYDIIPDPNSSAFPRYATIHPK
jgi:hypothetical protein